MAEATGLVIGAVALASLFSTCVDAVDCIHNGKNYRADYSHACAKMDVLKCRLSTWGQTLNVLSPGCEDFRLRHHWLEVQEVVTQSLSAIKDILDSTRCLADRYKVPRQSPGCTEVSDPSNSKHSKTFSRRSSRSAVATSQRLSLVWRRATWAIQDRHRFDAYLEKLAFFVDNLEQVVKHVNMSDPQVANQGHKLSDPVNSPEHLRGHSDKDDKSGSGNTSGNSSSNNQVQPKFAFKEIVGSKFLQGTSTDVQHLAGSGPSSDTFGFGRVENSQFHQADHDERARRGFFKK